MADRACITPTSSDLCASDLSRYGKQVVRDKQWRFRGGCPLLPFGVALWQFDGQQGRFGDAAGNEVDEKRGRDGIMDQRYEFEGSEVLALLEESANAAERMMTEAQRYVAAGVNLLADDPRALDEVEHPGTGAPPGLWLMNDRGVYLRSNAAKRRDDSVAFARGYRAEVQTGEEAVCEFIGAEALKQLLPSDTLVVTVSDKKMRLSLIRP